MTYEGLFLHLEKEVKRLFDAWDIEVPRGIASRAGPPSIAKTAWLKPMTNNASKNTFLKNSLIMITPFVLKIKVALYYAKTFTAPLSLLLFN